MASIFISYNRESEEIAKSLVGDIEALGHTVWFDQELSGGQVWWDQILERVRDCDVFVFVLTPEALDSTACKREYGYAVDLGKHILPVVVSAEISINRLPPALSQIQYVNYLERDIEAVQRLAKALTSLPRPEPLPDPLPIPPDVPVSYLGSLSERVEANTLSQDEQSTLALELKRSLRDPEARDDARELLKTLRKRRDLFAPTAEEIDELLAGGEAPAGVSHPTEPESVPPKYQRKGTTGGGEGSRKRVVLFSVTSVLLVLIGIGVYAFWQKEMAERALLETQESLKQDKLAKAKAAEEQRQREAAEHLAEKERLQEEEAKRAAEEQRQREEEAAQEERRQREAAEHLAEKERLQEEEAKRAVEEQRQREEEAAREERRL